MRIEIMARKGDPEDQHLELGDLDGWRDNKEIEKISEPSSAFAFVFLIRI